jgi:hypothetical protein
VFETALIYWYEGFVRLWKYLWAFPATLLGLAFVPLTWLTGGTIAVKRGVLEIHGGAAAAFLRRGVPGLGPAAAMTLDHVILGRDQHCLDQSREHEHVHVGQYERWGLLMIPAYLLASLAVFLRGGDPYLDNPFERQAYERQAQERDSAGPPAA